MVVSEHGRVGSGLVGGSLSAASRHRFPFLEDKVMKFCSGCDRMLFRSGFWKNKRRYDGLQSLCKSCLGAVNRKWKQTKEGKVSVRKTNQRGVDSRKRYAQTEKGKVALRKAAINYRNKFPERERAHWKTQYVPVRGVCERCRKRTAECKHHPDYSQPMLIEMLCTSCHREVHHAC